MNRNPASATHRPVPPASKGVRRQLFWSALGVIVVSGSLLALALNQLRQQAIDAGRRLNESLAHVVEEQAAHAVDAVDRRLQLAAQGLALLDASGGLTADSAGALLRQQQAALPYVRAIWVLDPRGRVAYAADPAHVGVDLADRAYFKVYRDQLQTGFYLGEPIRSRTNGQWLIAAARPLPSAGGTFAGVVVAGIDPPYFDNLWHALDLGDDGAVALFNRGGTLLMRSPFLDSAMGQSFAATPMFSQALAAAPSGSYAGASPIDSKERLNAYRSVTAQPGLVVLVARTATTVLAPWRQQAQVAVGVWAAAATVIGLLFVALNHAMQQGMRADSRARMMSERLVLATDAAAIGVWDWDVVADTWQASPTYYTMLGYPPEPDAGDRDRWLHIVHPDHRAEVEQKIRAVRAGSDQPYEYEARLRHADGSLRWVSVVGRVLERDAPARPTRLVGVRTDITMRKQAEAALRESEERYRQIVQTAGEGIWTTDADACTTFVNPRMAQMLGYTVDEMIGRPLSDFLDEAGCAAAPQRLAHQRQGLAEQGELRLLRKDGAAVWCLLATNPVFGPDGTLKGTLAMVTDITARQHAQASLQASLRDKEALLKEVHHRVKNNLQVIHSLLRLETGRNVLPATQAVLRAMQGRIQSMALLHESLYRSGTFASVDLGAYLRQLATQAFRSVQAGPDVVRLELALAAVQVGMDQAIPCGLLVNELISNCLKHAFPDGRGGAVQVELQVLGEGAELRLCVCDTGVGLPVDFEARRAQSLGLQLVADLAAQLGGRLDIGPLPQAAFSVTFRPDALPRAADPA